MVVDMFKECVYSLYVDLCYWVMNVIGTLYINIDFGPWESCVVYYLISEHYFSEVSQVIWQLNKDDVVVTGVSYLYLMKEKFYYTWH